MPPSLPDSTDGDDVVAGSGSDLLPVSASAGEADSPGSAQPRARRPSTITLPPIVPTVLQPPPIENAPQSPLPDEVPVAVRSVGTDNTNDQQQPPPPQSAPEPPPQPAASISDAEPQKQEDALWKDPPAALRSMITQVANPEDGTSSSNDSDDDPGYLISTAASQVSPFQQPAAQLPMSIATTSSLSSSPSSSLSIPAPQPTPAPTATTTTAVQPTPSATPTVDAKRTRRNRRSKSPSARQRSEQQLQRKPSPAMSWFRFLACCCIPEAEPERTTADGDRVADVAESSAEATEELAAAAAKSKELEADEAASLPSAAPNAAAVAAEAEEAAVAPVAPAAEAIQAASAEEAAVSGSSKEHGLLGPLAKEDIGKKCLVLDLDETLVHSSFKPVRNCDFVVPVEIDWTVHRFYVLKRPGVDEFLRRVGSQFEVVVFTASLAKYADPVLDILDIHRVVKHRLFRDSCKPYRGNYVKDLSMLGRPLSSVIILDNSPASYALHPQNAVPVSTWFNDPNDTELADLAGFLDDLRGVGDVRAVLGR